MKDEKTLCFMDEQTKKRKILKKMTRREDKEEKKTIFIPRKNKDRRE